MGERGQFERNANIGNMMVFRKTVPPGRTDCPRSLDTEHGHGTRIRTSPDTQWPSIPCLDSRIDDGTRMLSLHAAQGDLPSA